jgi:hypothetical protein
MTYTLLYADILLISMGQTALNIPLTYAHSVTDALLQEFYVKLFKIFFVPVRSIIKARDISFLYSKYKQNKTKQN